MKKKGRTRRNDDKDSDDEEYLAKPKSGGLKKLSKMEQENSEAEEDKEAPQPSEFKIKKKLKVESTENDQSKKNGKAENASKVLRYNSERLNVHQVFQEIIESTYTDQSVMLIMKNALSNGKKNLSMLEGTYKKKWANLKNSNMSEIDYRNSEALLKQTEENDFRKAKESIYQFLSATKVRAFETKEAVKERFMKFVNENNNPLEIQAVGNNYLANLQEQEYKKYREDIMQVIDLLLNERNLTEESDFNWERDLGERKKLASFEPKLEKTDSEQKAIEKEKPAKDIKPQKAQRKKKTCYIGKFFLESDNVVNDALKKYKWNEFFGIQAKDKLLLKKSDVPVINSSSIERSSDDVKLQLHYGKCVEHLKKYEKEVNRKTNDTTIKDLIYVTNFTMYNLHSLQKHHTERQAIHPADVIHVLNKYL